MKKNKEEQKNVIQKVWTWIRADKKRWIAGIVILAIALFGVINIVKNSGKNKNTYQTSVVTKGTVVSTISASGKAITTSSLTVGTNASGIVSKVYVKDGDKVFKGQKIAEITLDTDGALKNAQAYASYLSAANGVNSANNNYRSSQATLANVYDQIKGHDTDETLVQKETRTKAEVANDNAYDQTKSAQANLISASLLYQQSSPIIISPGLGTISSISLVEGMVITNTNTSSSTSTISSQRVAVIKNDATPIVNVTLSETDVPNVKIGQKATVAFDSITDKTFTGVVATVDRIGTVSSNVTSYGVNIKLDSGSDAILPNMAATADIITDSATDVLYVPSSSLITQNGSTFAKTLVNGKEVDVAVEAGISSDTNTVITSGLTEGQTVITGITTAASTSSTTTRSVFSTGGFGGGGAVRVQGR
jgi:multidrug efflux pump subunit AcrA (membrane-fusion protein)